MIKDKKANACCNLIDKRFVFLNADTSALERQIDEMVYKLYGLTEEEIEIVEGRK